MRTTRFCLCNLLLLFLLIAFCPAQQTSSLRIAGTGIQTLELTAADLKQMPRITLDIQEPHKGVMQHYEGVRLSDLLSKGGVPLGDKLRGPALATYVVAEASDGYAVVYSIAELDPDLTDNRIILADTMEGKPLAGKEGPFRIVVPGDKRPARWIRMVNVLRVENAVAAGSSTHETR